MPDGLTRDQIAWTKLFTGLDLPPPPEPPGGAPEKQPDPAVAAPAHRKNLKEVLFLKEDGDSGEITGADIHQGRLGDCYLLSSIGEIARINPDVIRKMIKDNGDGTYTVTLHRRKGGFGNFVAGLFGGHPEFEEVKETVDGNFPLGNAANKGSANQGATQDVVGDKKEIWVQVIEKAYAKLMGGYSKIGDGGWANDTLETLTGQEAKQVSVSGVTLADLYSDFKAGKPIVMNTPEKTKLPYNLAGPHAYMLEDILLQKGGKAMIKLRNPWGGEATAQPPALIPFDKLGDGITSIDIGGKLPPPPAAGPGKTP